MLLIGGQMKREQRGATVVEAALIVPILLLFLIGILEFGRAYNEYQVLTNAAREACRYATARGSATAGWPAALGCRPTPRLPASSEQPWRPTRSRSSCNAIAF